MNKKHPSAWDPAIMLLNILVSVIGSIIGLELIARLGISTNTSIIGALFAIIIARIPLKIFQKYKDINTQNLVQTAMSGATFAASNGIFLSIGIPYLLGRHDLVIPMMVGASLAVIIDATILYKVFDTEMFPAKEAWAPGIAAAEAMLAVAEKGKNSVILMIGMVGGIVGKIFGIPTDILGVGWIGNMWALGAFGVGLSDFRIHSEILQHQTWRLLCTSWCHDWCRIRCSYPDDSDSSEKEQERKRSGSS